MAYTSIQDIINDINAKFPDNDTRLITPAILRQVMIDTAIFMGTYFNYKPSILTLTNGTMTIPISADLESYYGSLPSVEFFTLQEGVYVKTEFVWSVEAVPPAATVITVEVGAAPVTGFVLIH